jgi:hypothetical protein
MTELTAHDHLDDDGGRPAFITVLTVGALALEVVLVAVVLAGAWWGYPLVAHLLIVGTLLMVIALTDASSVHSDSLQQFTLLLFLAGPLGGAAALISEQMSRNLDPRDLARWHETIAPRRVRAVTIADLIMDRRVVAPQSQLPRSYEESLANGSIEEQQALLGYLASQDDPEVVQAALKIALRSPEPRIRVQAAAVAAHFRERHRGVVSQPNPDTVH